MNKFLITNAIFSSSYAVGAVLLGNPIGAGGGAVYGVVSNIVMGSTRRLLDQKIINEKINNRFHNIIIATLGVGVSRQLMVLAGFNLTLKSAMILSWSGCWLSYGTASLAIKIIPILRKRFSTPFSTTYQKGPDAQV